MWDQVVINMNWLHVPSPLIRLLICWEMEQQSRAEHQQNQQLSHVHPAQVLYLTVPKMVAEHTRDQDNRNDCPPAVTLSCSDCIYWSHLVDFFFFFCLFCLSPRTVMVV